MRLMAIEFDQIIIRILNAAKLIAIIFVGIGDGVDRS